MKKSFLEKLGMVKTKDLTETEIKRDIKVYMFMALFSFASLSLITILTGDNSFVALGVAVGSLMFSGASLAKIELLRRETSFLKNLRDADMKVVYQLLEDHNSRLRAIEQKFKEA